jgi:sphinganine-1-phosphate aldolase
VKRKVFTLLKKISFINAKINEELGKSRKGLEADIYKANKGIDYIRSLPELGLHRGDLDTKLNDYLKLSDTKWRDGAVSGCVYGADDDLTELTAEVYKRFSWHNVMHAGKIINVSINLTRKP